MSTAVIRLTVLELKRNPQLQTVTVDEDSARGRQRYSAHSQSAVMP